MTIAVALVTLKPFLSASAPTKEVAGKAVPPQPALLLAPDLPVDVEDSDPDFKNLHNPDRSTSSSL